MLGDYEDMKRRVILANEAMKSIDKIWPSRKVHINRKLKAYKTIAKSVMCYNYQTWGLTKAQREELDRSHRKQLRRVWNDPNKRNQRLYEESNENKLSDDMRNAKWRAMGHMLRLNRETPCQKAMDYYFEENEKFKKFAGRMRTTLPVTINEDIKIARSSDNTFPISKLENSHDLMLIRDIASDRKLWRELTEKICNPAQGES